MQRSGALPYKEAGAGAVGHVVHQSPPMQGGRVQSYATHGGVRALSIIKAGSGATGHVAALEPTVAGRQGPMLQGTWRHVGARPTPCLDLKLVRRVSTVVGGRRRMRWCRPMAGPLEKEGWAA
jgi:hypothetical protein